GRLASNGQQFLERRVDSGDRAQRCERAAVGGMDVLVLIEMCEFLVWWLVGERQTATAAACFAAVRANLVTLTAVATADRGDVINQVLIVSHTLMLISCELLG